MMQLCSKELSFDLLHANSILQEPIYLFILVNNISSSTVLSNNLQNLRGKTLHLQSPPFWTIVDKTGIDKELKVCVMIDGELMLR